MEFSGEVWGSKRTWLNFGGNLDHNVALAEICTLLVLHLVSLWVFLEGRGDGGVIIITVNILSPIVHQWLF